MREQHSYDPSLAVSCSELLAFVCFSLDQLLINALPCHSETYCLTSLYDGAQSNLLVVCRSPVAMMQAANAAGWR
jgi:hypothetical protein